MELDNIQLRTIFKKPQRGNKQSSNRTLECFNYNKKGHKARNYRSKKKVQGSQFNILQKKKIAVKEEPSNNQVTVRKKEPRTSDGKKRPSYGTLYWTACFNDTYATH